MEAILNDASTWGVEADKINRNFKKSPIGVIGKNKFNKNNVTTGAFVNPGSGGLEGNADYCYSEYIPMLVVPYYIRNFAFAVFYNSAKEFISGEFNMNGWGGTPPAGTAYVRMSLPIISLDIAQIELGTTPTVYEPYRQMLEMDNIQLSTNFNLVKHTEISVSLDGTKDFLNPVAAIDYINTRNDATELNQYDVLIYEGEYDIVAELDPAKVANVTTRGLEIPDFVNIIGIGARERTIFKGELPLTATDTQVTQISPLNYERGGILKNITVTAKNMRYAVHADGNEVYKDYEGRIENCYFEHFGNDVSYTWQSCAAWGSGCHSGSKREFDSCTFVSKNQDAFGVHTNVSFDNPAYTKAVNCKFINKAGGVALSLISLNSGQINRFEFVGCSYNGFLKVYNSSTLNDDDIVVTGYGNEKTPHFFDTKGNLDQYIQFTDEVKYLKNTTASTIAKGSPLKSSGYSGCEPIGSSNIQMLCGIALEDILAGEIGAVKYTGYVTLTDLGIAANVGDKIGVTAGNIAVVSSDNFGIVTIAGYVKLI